MFTAGVWKVLDSFIHELKQRRWRRLRKRHLKSEFGLPHFILIKSSNGKFLWSWILKDCIKVQEKKSQIVILCSSPRQNVKLGTFTLWSCNDGWEMYKKAWCKCKVVVLPIQTHCFFSRSHCRHRHRCLSSLCWFTAEVTAAMLVTKTEFLCSLETKLYFFMQILRTTNHVKWLRTKSGKGKTRLILVEMLG